MTDKEKRVQECFYQYKAKLMGEDVGQISLGTSLFHAVAPLSQRFFASKIALERFKQFALFYCGIFAMDGTDILPFWSPAGKGSSTKEQMIGAAHRLIHAIVDNRAEDVYGLWKFDNLHNTFRKVGVVDFGDRPPAKLILATTDTTWTPVFPFRFLPHYKEPFQILSSGHQVSYLKGVPRAIR